MRWLLVLITPEVQRNIQYRFSEYKGFTVMKQIRSGTRERRDLETHRTILGIRGLNMLA
jgi:hypothetical protein